MKKKPEYDKIYVDHKLDCIERLERIAKTTPRNDIAEMAAIRAIEVIGEAANNLSDALKQSFPDVSWRQMIDMRNLLIHGYFEVESARVWQVCDHDVPQLKQALIRIQKEIN